MPDPSASTPPREDSDNPSPPEAVKAEPGEEQTAAVEPSPPPEAAPETADPGAKPEQGETTAPPRVVESSGRTAEDAGGAGSTAVTCRNCGTALRGEYCYRCGQRARDLDVSFRELVADWLGGAFGLDARLWRTLKLLFLRPGQLTVEFLEGRRARYLPPFRLYLISSVLLFLTLTYTGYSMVRTTGGPDQRSEGGVVVWTDRGEEEGGAAPDDGSAEPAEDGESPEATESTDEPKPEEGDAGSDEPALGPPGATAPETGGSIAEAGASEGTTSEPEPAGITSRSHSAAEEEAGEPAADTASGAGQDGEPPAENTGETAKVDEDSGVLGAVFGGLSERIQKDGKSFNRSFQDTLAQVLFLLVPVFALQLRLYFRRRHRRYLYHLIFSLHLHAALFFAISVVRLSDPLAGFDRDGPFGNVVALLILIYTFMALRRMYDEGRLGTGAKLAVLFFVQLFCTLAVMLLTLVLTVLLSPG
ncbi:MAG: DUF3667 domain-containing protein [Holophagales bacterium]|nr:DUF3667 domain-containing protein [Holophagales bacterium]